MNFLFLLCLVLFQADIPYRMLNADLSKPKEADYAISIERPIGRTDLERVVCKVLVKEAALKFERVNVRVFVGLRAYVKDEEYDEPVAATAEKQLGWYVWNRTLPRVRGRLVLMKAMDGTPLAPWDAKDFSHENTCRK